MSKEFRDAMQDLLVQKEKIARMQEQLKESVKGVAQRFDCKPAQVTKVLALVQKEREKGGALEDLQAILGQAESVLL